MTDDTIILITLLPVVLAAFILAVRPIAKHPSTLFLPSTFAILALCFFQYSPTAALLWIGSAFLLTSATSARMHYRLEQLESRIAESESDADAQA